MSGVSLLIIKSSKVTKLVNAGGLGLTRTWQSVPNTKRSKATRTDIFIALLLHLNYEKIPLSNNIIIIIIIIIIINTIIIIMGGLGITNPCNIAASENEASTATTEPLVEQIMAQTHELPDDRAVRTLQQCNRREKNARLRDNLEGVTNALPEETKTPADLAAEKGASSWLTFIPVQDVDFTLTKGEFKDAIHLRYDWQISETPSACACGVVFDVDHAMVCRQGGFIIQKHNELRDLEAQMLKMECNDVQIEPVLREIKGEVLKPSTNRAADARLDIYARGFWELR